MKAFYRAEVHWWPTIADKLARLGEPWDDFEILHDLRWWSDQQRMHALGVGGKPMPGRKVLAKRWGVSDWKCRQMLRREDEWRDPYHAPTTLLPRDDHGADASVGNDVDAPTTLLPRADHVPPHARTTQDTGHRAPVGDPSILGDFPITVEQSSTHEDAPAEPPEPVAEPSEPSPQHWTADLWSQLQAIRSEHLPGARGQGLTAKRKANLVSRTKELRQAGLSRDDLLRAARWVHESANIRAEGARNTGDPLGVLLRPAHCVEYCELAEAEERQGDAVVHRASAAGGPSNSQPETPPTLEQPGDDPRWGQWGLDARERESLRYTLGNIEHARSRGDLTTERKIQSYYDQKMTTLERQHATPAPVLRLVDGGQA